MNDVVEWLRSPAGTKWSQDKHRAVQYTDGAAFLFFQIKNDTPDCRSTIIHETCIGAHSYYNGAPDLDFRNFGLSAYPTMVEQNRSLNLG